MGDDLNKLMQLGMGGAVAVYLVSVVLNFVLKLLGGRQSERKQLNDSLAELSTNVSDNTIQMKILQDRDMQVMQTLRDFNQRIIRLEQHASEVRGAAGSGVLGEKLSATAVTPAMGVPRVTGMIPIVEINDEDDQ